MSEHDKCHEYFEKISEMLDRELNGDTEARIRAHIESCPECRVCWATFSKSVEIFHHLSPEMVPPGFLDELKNLIRQSET